MSIGKGMNPKVFISHASEDKDRFVIRFWERLRGKGIDAWLDKWEMLPGDKLVDKVFNQGLRLSDAVIVVLSNYSVQKPWVQKELDTAVVKNVEDKTKLIPVRLDGCSIPECLRDTLYVSILDLDNYDAEFDRIVSVIHGQHEVPPLGDKPEYAKADILQLEGLCRSDSLVLSQACDIALEQGHPTILDPDAFVAKLGQKGMAANEIEESLQVLNSNYYVKLLEGPGYLFNITTSGFTLFGESGGIPKYNEKITAVARMLVQRMNANVGQPVTYSSIESELDLPPMLVEHVLERLRDHGQIKYETEKGGRLFMHVYWVSPEIRRKLEGSG